MSTSTEHLVEFAATFGKALHDGHFVAAHAMLTPALAGTTSAADLLEEYEVLAEDMGGVTGIGPPAVILEEWPGKGEQDLAMVYIPLEGDMFSEAATVTVAESGSGLCVAGIEWGRP